MMLLMMILILSVLFLLIMVSWLISFKEKISREKLTPFECGFDPLLSRHISFYISYYIFSLIFLVFDVEIVLLFPYVFVIKGLSLSFASMMLFIFFMLLLMMGLLIEYLECSLEWSS